MVGHRVPANAVLTKELVVDLRRYVKLHGRGARTAWAKAHGVSVATAAYACSGRTWGHVGDEPPVVGYPRPYRLDLSPEERHAYAKAYHRRYYEQRRDEQRDQYRRLRYGLEPGQYDAMRAAQDDRCAICQRPETRLASNGKPKLLSVDHCHASGRVRELLCVGCNVGLGGFEDDVDLLRAAIAYLERHRD
jgi:hypothetical protein